jgi:hypothetical protein
MPPLLQGIWWSTDIEQELMFVGREEGKLLAIRQLVGKVSCNLQLSSLCRVRNVREALWRIALTVFVDVIHAGRSKSARCQWPSLGKETHGKCLLSFGVVAMIRFL